MIKIGKYNDLTILKKIEDDFILVDETGEEILLKKKHIPEEHVIGDLIRVFVYLNNEEKKVATSVEPKVKLDEFAFLTVVTVNQYGAFLDWGMGKDLFVPFKEQRMEMETGNSYVVYMDFDEKSNRLFASSRIENYLQNEQLSVSTGQEVAVMIVRATDIGYTAIVNNEHQGLVYKNETFRSLNIGDRVKGFVKKIREDNKLDISLEPIGYSNFNDKNAEAVLQALKTNDGFLPFNDKSAPEAIYDKFGISKKAFKKALGALYKAKLIVLGDDGTKLV